MIGDRDPRKNAPPCISHMTADEQRLACIARHKAYRAAHMRRFAEANQPGRFSRLVRRLPILGRAS